MIRYPHETNPYLVLAAPAFEVTADCGCHIHVEDEDGIKVKLFHCTMHAAAPELLEALVGVLSIGPGLSVANEQFKETAQTVVRRAQGQSQD